MRTLPLKLASNSDILENLQEIAQNENSFGYVLSAVGNLSSAAFQCPGKEKPELVQGDLEIITLNGTISPQACHLHLSISDTTCQVLGGHLERGSLVLKGADLLLGFLNHESALYTPAVSRIEVYVLENCPWSKRVLRMLNQLNLPHKTKLVSSDSEFDLLYKKTKSQKFPQILIDGIYIGGYEALVELNEKGQLKEIL